MVKKKRLSKRIGLNRRYRIKKKISEHKRKQKKGKDKDQNQMKQKDPGIPNQWPFKEQLLEEISQAKREVEDLKKREKERRKEEVMKLRNRETYGFKEEIFNLLTPEQKLKLERKHKNKNNVGKNEPKMVENCAVETIPVETVISETANTEHINPLFIVRKAIEEADIVFEVLDARDPLGSRSLAVEKTISINYGKRIILILNKIDLIPSSNAAQWLSYLRCGLPTLGFTTLQHSGERIGTDQSTQNQGVGVDSLLTLIKNYQSRLGEPKQIKVAVIGLPQVGKTSLINSIKNTMDMSNGFKDVEFLDCAPLTPDSTDDGEALGHLLSNFNKLHNPLNAVGSIIRRCTPNQLILHYKIPTFNPEDVKSFLKSIGTTSQKGLTNDTIARKILEEWRKGKVHYYCQLPAQSISRNSIFAEFDAEFDGERLTQMDKIVLNTASHQKLGLIALSSNMSIHMGKGNKVSKFLSYKQKRPDDKNTKNQNPKKNKTNMNQTIEIETKNDDEVKETQEMNNINNDNNTQNEDQKNETNILLMINDNEPAICIDNNDGNQLIN